MRSGMGLQSFRHMYFHILIGELGLSPIKGLYLIANTITSLKKSVQSFAASCANVFTTPLATVTA